MMMVRALIDSPARGCAYVIAYVSHSPVHRSQPAETPTAPNSRKTKAQNQPKSPNLNQKLKSTKEVGQLAQKLPWLTQ
jgi:hypothetical protein